MMHLIKTNFGWFSSAQDGTFARKFDGQQKGTK